MDYRRVAHNISRKRDCFAVYGNTYFFDLVFLEQFSWNEQAVIYVVYMFKNWIRVVRSWHTYLHWKGLLLKRVSDKPFQCQNVVYMYVKKEFTELSIVRVMWRVDNVLIKDIVSCFVLSTNAFSIERFLVDREPCMVTSEDDLKEGLPVPHYNFLEIYY